MKVEKLRQPQTLLRKIRTTIPIYYSTTTNTAKNTAEMLQQKLEKSDFICDVINVGNIDKDKFIETHGPVIFIVSTYGDGDSPVDGENFMKWISQGILLENMQFAILGLGNKNFEHFCKNAINLRTILLANKAKQFSQIALCNAAKRQQSVNVIFEQWSNNILQKLKQQYQIRQMQINKNKSQPNTLMILNKQNINDNNWQRNKQYWYQILNKQYLIYHQSYRVQVIHIKQLRKQDDGRTTLWIRLQKPQNMLLQPACNICVYPQNVRKYGQKQIQGSFRIQKNINNNTNKNIKIQYPPMNLQTLWKISNFNQKANINHIRYAILLSNAKQQIINKYINYINNPNQLQKDEINCLKLYQQLQPSYQFMLKLGINQVRPYTIASWDIKQPYFDIIVSIIPQGLASNYFNSSPEYMKIKMYPSSFYIPERRPIVMIANGVGIAPFRSLVQYFINNPQYSMPQMHLFYGIRDKKKDYFFEEEWQELQKLGKIKIHIAQSRIDPQKKVYVQDLLAQNRDFITKHIFENNGVVFICGSANMAQSVSDEIYQIVKKRQKVPIKACKVFNQLFKNKIIVKQVFH